MDDESRRESRLPARLRVEFFVDADIVEAETVDVSESGVRLNTREPIPIRMRIYDGEKETDHQAHVIWARRKEDGSMSYGLEFDEMPEW